MTTPRDGTPEEAAPRVRKAAVERAMRRRSRRMSGKDRSTRPPERSAERRVRERRTTEPVRRRTRPERPTKRRVMVRRSVAASVIVGLAAIVVVVLWTPVLGVRSVDVTGTRELTAGQVVAAAQVPTGTPMLRLDTGAIQQRVARLPRVSSVDVVREWPDAVRIDVTERDPIGYLTRPNGKHLVDATGLDYATVATPPPGLPAILLPTVSPVDQRTQAVVAVLAALPQQLRPLLATVSANTPGSVTLGLSDGRTIRWGSADDSARKAQVLAALMTQPGKVYDVSSPDLPTIS